MFRNYLPSPCVTRSPNFLLPSIHSTQYNYYTNIPPSHISSPHYSPQIRHTYLFPLFPTKSLPPIQIAHYRFRRSPLPQITHLFPILPFSSFSPPHSPLSFPTPNISDSFHHHQPHPHPSSFLLPFSIPPPLLPPINPHPTISYSPLHISSPPGAALGGRAFPGLMNPSNFSTRDLSSISSPDGDPFNAAYARFPYGCRVIAGGEHGFDLRLFLRRVSNRRYSGHQFDVALDQRAGFSVAVRYAETCFQYKTARERFQEHRQADGR